MVGDQWSLIEWDGYNALRRAGWRVVGMSRRFFGQQITVERDQETREPTSFSFKDETHDVTLIMTSWQDYGMPSDGRKHTWRQRHHRNYYRVQTSDGRVFEIYYDRGVSMDSPKYMRWYVTKEL